MLILIEHTGHHTLLHMVLCSSRPVRVPLLTRVDSQKHLQWASAHQNWTTEQWKRVWWIQEWFGKHNNKFKVLPPNSPDLNQIEHLWNVLEKTRLIHGGRHLVPSYLLLIAWYQILQHTFRSPVESLSRWVVLGDHDMAEWYINLHPKISVGILFVIDRKQYHITKVSSVSEGHTCLKWASLQIMGTHRKRKRASLVALSVAPGSANYSIYKKSIHPF